MNSYGKSWRGFEAPHISILVDACHAGEFVDRFANHNGYLVMTSTDESHVAFAVRFVSVPLFSNTFWVDLAIYPGHSAKTAFYNARLVNPLGNPQIVDNANYNFF